MRAEISPSFIAVKKADPKMPTPEKRKAKEKRKIALCVMSINTWSYPTKSFDKGVESNCAEPNMRRENAPIMMTLFLNKLLNSS